MAKPAPSRVAAALDYLERLKNQTAEFGGGVVENLADRARSVGGLAYEGLLHRLYANSPTPRIDQAAQDLGTIGRAIVTQPIQTGKAIVQGEIDRAQEATTSPRAAGEYAGSFIDPMRIAAALRRTAPVLELDVYHGTPHRFPATEANPLGEFDASKIGTGEGAQAYGHGVYYAENPEVAKGYQPRDLKSEAKLMNLYKQAEARQNYDAMEVLEAAMLHRTASELKEQFPKQKGLVTRIGKINEKAAGSLYKADLPNEMIDRMLDWDKPLSEQSAEVRKLFPSLDEATAIDAEMTRLSEAALTANDINSPAQAAWDAMYKSPRYKLAKVVVDEANPKLKGKFANGDEVYRAIGGGNDKVASETLRSLGIPGIRYLDAGSRDGATGTRNFVVFPGEEKKVRILERDGQKAPPQKIAQALEAAPQGGKVVGIRSRQTAKMADRINEALGGGPQPLSDNVQREMKLATSVLQSKNPQAVEDWVQAYYNADLPMEQFEAATTNLRKTLPPETVDALIQNAGAFGTADQFKAFLNATPAERTKQLTKVSK